MSVVIPARNEANCIGRTIENIHLELLKQGIPHEIIVIDDGSTDRTWEIVTELALSMPECRPVRNVGKPGFGNAVTLGFSRAEGDGIVVMMADESDDHCDLVEYWDKLCDGWDAVFGSRFMRGGSATDYPRAKLLLNRLVNWGLRILFGVPFNDFTNAFKAYRREALESCRPYLSPHFNLTIELPLKIIVRGCSWTVVPVKWRNRRVGESKFRIREMGSRYLFIALYCWLEKYFSCGDYRADSSNGAHEDRLNGSS